MNGQLTQYYDYVKHNLFNFNGNGALVRTIEGIPHNGVMNFFSFLLVAAYMGYLVLGSSKNKKNKKGDNNVNPIPNVKNIYNKRKYTDDQSSAPKTDKWKHDAWRKWILNLDDRWNTFSRNVDKHKGEWMDQKDGQLIEWVKELQAKWMHFNPNIDQEYKIEFLKKSENWTDDKWKIWMLTEAQQLLENDLKEWLSQAEADYCKWTMDAWNQWKDSQIKEWITLDWKYEEDTFFSKIDEFTVESLPPEDQRLWYSWKERIYKEGSDWKYWASLKESKYVNENWELWEEWKNEKQEMFSEWLQLYTNKWIQQKQWRLWIGEKMSQNDQKLTSESISVGASAGEKNDEVKNDEVKNDEVKNDEVKNDEVKNDEVKNDEVKNDEVKTDEKKSEMKKDDGTNGIKIKYNGINESTKTDEKKREMKKDDGTNGIKIKYNGINESTKTDEKKSEMKKDDGTNGIKIKYNGINESTKTDEKKSEMKKDGGTNGIKIKYNGINESTKTDEKKEDTDTSSLNGDENKQKNITNPYLRNSIFI
ncbi:Plasmodium exported protein, unknown function [Plasmodium berghei]|uniref:Tryptophan/threonine-rich plasmodium antigen C-terminal domain-containing protein n=1 Tax=Plasmodium berghei TaxID=5821 RepID=A0A1D3L696_PLABE|nr:Plasmodium exported protein, unknown function [Plasmodium berghei]SCL82470.1 Plasmodium exported protein, unknown function [Plasmodium berghei]